MKSSTNKKYKYLLVSIISTLLFLTLFSGLIIVEKNTRYVAFGDSSPFLTYEHHDNSHFSLTIHFMGNNYKMSF